MQSINLNKAGVISPQNYAHQICMRFYGITTNITYMLIHLKMYLHYFYYDIRQDVFYEMNKQWDWFLKDELAHFIQAPNCISQVS
jgi:hypothetical protein